MYKKRTLFSSAEIRQQALDYINANPRAYVRNITATLGWSRSTTATRLLGMVKTGELSREDDGAYHRYTALKKIMGGNKILVGMTVNGITSNTDQRRMPIQNQGGQGNLQSGWRRTE